MALIAQFESRPIDPRRIHGEVTCGFAWRDLNGRRILQLETYGSPDRKIPEKVSQSLQLDREGAIQLKRILEQAFPGV